VLRDGNEEGFDDLWVAFDLDLGEGSTAVEQQDEICFRADTVADGFASPRRTRCRAMARSPCLCQDAKRLGVGVLPDPETSRDCRGFALLDGDRPAALDVQRLDDATDDWTIGDRL